MSKIIESISDIISLYDVFILDQWGVMHDGYKGYDCAINSVEKLIKEINSLVLTDGYKNISEAVGKSS